MLRVASDATYTQRLLLALEQEAEGQPGSPLRPRLDSAFGAPAHARAGSSSSAGDLTDSPGDAPAKGSDAVERKPSLSKSPFDSSPAELVAVAAPPAPHHQRFVSEATTEASELASPQMTSPQMTGKTSGGGAHGGGPRRGRAPFGRQLSVMFWRTFVDIGALCAALCWLPGVEAAGIAGGPSCCACPRRLAHPDLPAPPAPPPPQCATPRCCCCTRWWRW